MTKCLLRISRVEYLSVLQIVLLNVDAHAREIYVREMYLHGSCMCIHEHVLNFKLKS